MTTQKSEEEELRIVRLTTRQIEKMIILLEASIASKDVQQS